MEHNVLDINELILKIYEYILEETQDTIIAQVVSINEQEFQSSQDNAYMGNLFYEIAINEKTKQIPDTEVDFNIAADYYLKSIESKGSGLKAIKELKIIIENQVETSQLDIVQKCLSAVEVFFEKQSSEYIDFLKIKQKMLKDGNQVEEGAVLNEEIMEILKSGVQQNPGLMADQLYEVANNQYESHHDDKALENCAKALQLVSNDYQIYQEIIKKINALMGFIYIGLQNNEQAIHHYETAMRIQEELGDVSSADHCIYNNNLAHTMMQTSQFRQAQIYLEDCVENVNGKIARAYINFGKWYLLDGDAQKAHENLQLAENCPAAIGDLTPLDSLTRIAIYIKFGEVFLFQGDYSSTLCEVEKCLVQFEKVQEAQTNIEYYEMKILEIRALAGQGKLDVAIVRIHDIQVQIESIFGIDSIIMVKFFEAQAEFHYAKLDYKLAMEASRKAETILSHIWQQDNWYAIKIQVLYMSILVDDADVSQLDSEMENLDKLISRTMSILGDFHFFIPIVMSLQSKSLLIMSKYEEGLQLVEKSLELAKKSNIEDSYISADIYEITGRLLSQLKKRDPAKANLEKALMMKQQAHGSTHTKVAFTMIYQNQLIRQNPLNQGIAQILLNEAYKNLVINIGADHKIIKQLEEQYPQLKQK